MDIKRIYSGRFKSILFVGIISLFVFAIVKNKVYFNSNQNFVVSIIATGDKNNNSNSAEVWVREIKDNNSNVFPGDIELPDGWHYKNNSIYSDSVTSVPLEIVFESPNNSSITFEKHTWSGIVEIKSENCSEKIDLYSEKPGILKFNIPSTFAKENHRFYSFITNIAVYAFIFSLLLFCKYYIEHILKNTARTSNTFSGFTLEISFLFSILVIRSFYAAYWQWGLLCPDSFTYIDYSFEALLHMDFTQAGRTPVYPLILQIIKQLSGTDNYLNIVVAVQCIVSYISVIYMYKICNMISELSLMKYIITFMYGTTIVVCGWDYVILTESFALSGTVFFAYYIIDYIRNDQNGIKAIILLFVLIFLRPSFLLLFYILLLFLLIRVLYKKANTKKVFITWLVCWSAIMIYSGIFYMAHGIFSISDPMPRQLLYVCMERDYYQNYEDKEFVQKVQVELEKSDATTWSAMTEVLNYYGKNKSQKIAKKCIINNITQYIKDEWNISMEILQYDFGTYAQEGENVSDSFRTYFRILDTMTNLVKPIHGLLIGGITLFISIFNFARGKIAWLACGFSAFIWGIFRSTMILTCSEYARTMIHIVPFLFIAIVYLCEKYIYHKDYFVDPFPMMFKKQIVKKYKM